jgi:YYY domain-containing protein
MNQSTTTPNHIRRREELVSLALIAILLVGGALRFYNVNWDKDTYHIHPDERNTAMVLVRLQWPSSVEQDGLDQWLDCRYDLGANCDQIQIHWLDALKTYFDTSHSTLNPTNVGGTYFYGTFPLFLTKFVATVGDIVQLGQAQMSPDPAAYLASHGRLTDYNHVHLVGRVLSGLFDLGTVLLLFFLARRLFDWRVGLLASFLLAFTVLNIQGSHYFTVDTFLTFFVTLTLWFTVDVAEGKGWGAFTALGASMGFTLACKVSVFLLAAVVGLGVWMGWRRRINEGQTSGRAMWRSAGGLVLSVFVALAIFRVAQPYAWAGPNYTAWDTIPEPWGQRLQIFQKMPEPIRAVIMPNPEWIGDIVEAGAQQTGAADMPWGRQWTERTPWLWPLQNMVLWTLGVPLGVAGWLGAGLIAFLLIRRWWRRRGRERVWESGNSGIRGPGPRAVVVLPLAWVVLTFAWQGMQYVKSVRYFMPIHPFLAAFAGYLVVRGWDWARQRQLRRLWARIGAGVVAGFVAVGTLLWAFAFIQIYTEPITRVQASRWIYENVEEGSAIANEVFDDPLPFNLDGHAAFGSGMYRGLDLTLYDEDTPEKLDKLLDNLDQADYLVMSSGRLWQSIPRLPMRYPMTTRYYQLLFAGQLGFEKVAEFHSYPRLFGIEFNDTWAEEQFTVYDHPKVLIYHKTAAYDREQVKAMLSDGINWDTIPHWLNPKDVPKWKREQAKLASEQSQGQIIQVAKNDLMLTPDQQQVQEQGGTWASIFNVNSLPNQLPTLSWLVLVGILGLATLPLTIGVFHRLPDRGYILARPVGVLLLAWMSWILTNVTPLHYTRGTILLAFGLIAGVSLGTLLLPGQRRRLLDLWRTQKRLILVSEGLFLAFFVLFWFIRWGNPDLWHPWKGGEKPMDFAYLNAVIKSTEFPPYDPWFAGGYLNYYYFGQVMVGTLIKLIGIVPSVAYNLTIPLWFAMTAMGAFSVTYNLVAGRQGDKSSSGPEDVGRDDTSTSGLEGGGRVADPPHNMMWPILFGLLGALFVTVLGNLGEVHLLLLKLGQGVMDTFQSTIPGLAGLVKVVIGSFEVIFGGRALPIGLDEWYWNASRAIPAGPGESVITEFPFFTFLYADLHAHLIAMPLTFISLSAALAVVKGAGARIRGAGVSRNSWWRGLPAVLALLFVWALTIGAMRTTNTWDVPPHLLIALGALSIAAFAQRQPGWSGLLRMVWSVAWKLILLAVLAWSVLFWPFWASYGSYYNSIAVWNGTRTPLWAYLVVHGLFLFAIVSYLLARAFGHRDGQRPDPMLRRVFLSLRYRDRSQRLEEAARVTGARRLPVGRWVWVAAGLFVVLELFFLVPGLVSFTRADPTAVQSGNYAYRGSAVLALGLPIGILGLLLLFRTRISPTERLWSLLVLLGLGMTLGVEVVVLQGDIGRMNTVFKFYVQTWLIWGVAAAAALGWLVPRVQHWAQGRRLWMGALGILVLFAALYPPLAASAKIRDRFDPSAGPGLDGWAYMETSVYSDPQDGSQPYELKWDLEAIHWLLDNVVGSPVILEGQTTEYRWGSRYSINTGLPTVVGWNWHQRQQRAAGGNQEVLTRVDDVRAMYNTPSSSQVQQMLRQYHVRYVIVGPLERLYYDPMGLAKFDRMVTEGSLRVAYSNDQVTIYEVLP